MMRANALIYPTDRVRGCFREGGLNEAAGAADATRAILRTLWATERSESTFAYFFQLNFLRMLQAKVDSIPIA